MTHVTILSVVRFCQVNLYILRCVLRPACAARLLPRAPPHTATAARIWPDGRAAGKDAPLEDDPFTFVKALLLPRVHPIAPN